MPALRAAVCDHYKKLAAWEQHYAKQQLAELANPHPAGAFRSRSLVVNEHEAASTVLLWFQWLEADAKLEAERAANAH